jgi:hypothetical protein
MERRKEREKERRREGEKERRREGEKERRGERENGRRGNEEGDADGGGDGNGEGDGEGEGALFLQQGVDCSQHLLFTQGGWAPAWATEQLRAPHWDPPQGCRPKCNPSAPSQL